MKNLFTLLFTAISLSLFSQTKMIAYKSHSGNMKNFSSAAIDISEGNLGMKPNRIVKTAKLDSVIYENENESILVTSSTCETELGEKSTWKPGREVVHNSKLFSSKNKDSIKTILKNTYNFQNDIDDVVFVGYEKPTKKELRKMKKQQKKTIKIERSTSDNSKTHGETPYYLGLLVITSLAGVYSWKKNK